LSAGLGVILNARKLRNRAKAADRGIHFSFVSACPNYQYGIDLT
jgi:hypothetical protein